MKSFFMLLLLLSTMASAADRAPIHFDNLLKTIASASDLTSIQNSIVDLEIPSGMEFLTLKLFPAEAFKLTQISESVISVTIVNPALLYDSEIYGKTNILSMKNIEFKWIKKGSDRLAISGNGTPLCEISIKFELNGKEFTQANYDYFKASGDNVQFNFSVDGKYLPAQFTNGRLPVVRVKNDNDSTIDEVTMLISRNSVGQIAKATAAITKRCDNINLKSKNSSRALSLLSTSVKWDGGFLSSHSAHYAFLFENTSPEAQACKVFIKGVLLDNDEAVALATDFIEHDVVHIKPKQQIVLRGNLSIPYHGFGYHPGTDYSVECQAVK